jgi:hypothetical protein
VTFLPLNFRWLLGKKERLIDFARKKVFFVLLFLLRTISTTILIGVMLLTRRKPGPLPETGKAKVLAFRWETGLGGIAASFKCLKVRGLTTSITPGKGLNTASSLHYYPPSFSFSFPRCHLIPKWF